MNTLPSRKPSLAVRKEAPRGEMVLHLLTPLLKKTIESPPHLPENRGQARTELVPMNDLLKRLREHPRATVYLPIDGDGVESGWLMAAKLRLQHADARILLTGIVENRPNLLRAKSIGIEVASVA